MENTLSKIIYVLEGTKEPVSARYIAEKLNYTYSTIHTRLNQLIRAGQVLRVGEGKTTGYILAKEYARKSYYISEFKNISNAAELKMYLDNMNDRLNNTSVLCQYTTINAVIGIISEGCWYLGSPKNMNDGLELQEGLEDRDDIYFSSFMLEQKESIAMWSMYAQPWNDGVMISIPTKEFKRWIRDINVIYSADPKSKKPNRSISIPIDKVKLSASRVAYVEKNNDNIIENITCGGAKNSLLKEVSNSELVGYIKDDAWSYEKEFRLRVDTGDIADLEAIAIDVPDYLIDSMRIIKGPRFSGNLIERISESINRKLITDTSLFFNKLNYTPCDCCKFKRMN